MDPVEDGIKEMDPVEDGIEDIDSVEDLIILKWIQYMMGLKNYGSSRRLD